MTEAALRSVLKGPVNEWIRKRPGAAWLLPENATLFNLVEHGKAWLDLALVLVPLAESALNQSRLTFAMPSNPREALRLAIEKVKSQADRLDLLIYDPTMKDENRKEAWKAQLSNFISGPEFMAIVGLGDFAWDGLDEEHRLELLEDFMKMLHSDAEIFAKVHNKAVASGQTVARLDDLLEAFFPSQRRVLGLAAADFSMPKAVWSPAMCVADVRKGCPRMTDEVSARIVQEFDIWQHNDFFKGAKLDEVRDMLKECGANTTEMRLIIQNLKKHGII